MARLPYVYVDVAFDLMNDSSHWLVLPKEKLPCHSQCDDVGHDATPFVSHFCTFGPFRHCIETNSRFPLLFAEVPAKLPIIERIKISHDERVWFQVPDHSETPIRSIDAQVNYISDIHK